MGGSELVAGGIGSPRLDSDLRTTGNNYNYTLLNPGLTYLYNYSNRWDHVGHPYRGTSSRPWPRWRDGGCQCSCGRHGGRNPHGRHGGCNPHRLVVVG